MHLAARWLAGAASAAAFVGFGLWVTGADVRALSPARLGLQGDPGPLLPPEGARWTVGARAIDGAAAHVVEGTTDREAGAVLDDYAALAEREVEGSRAPYLRQDDPGGGGAVLWVTRSGARRAALVQADALRGARFRLISTPPPGEGEVASRMPLDLEPPAGARLVFSTVAADGSGFALLEVHGSARGAARRALERVQAIGLVADPEAVAALDEDAGPGQVALPLRDAAGPRGVILATAGGGGAPARVTLSIQPRS